jgi:hypothetical protein
MARITRPFVKNVLNDIPTSPEKISKELCLTCDQRTHLLCWLHDRRGLAEELQKTFDRLKLAAPYSLEQAQHLGVCRICGDDGGPKTNQDGSVDPFVLALTNGGNEHAHESCLAKQMADMVAGQLEVSKPEVCGVCDMAKQAKQAKPNRPAMPETPKRPSIFATVIAGLFGR